MYVRQDNRRRSFSIPQNYSGNAFIEAPVADVSETMESTISQDPCNDIEAVESHEAAPRTKSKGFLPINIGSEEMIILGLLLLLFQSEKGDDIIPLLLALLFIGGDFKS